MNMSGTRALWAIGSFLALLVVLQNLPDDLRSVVVPILIIAGFVVAAIKAPPIAIAILLYYSMIHGGWLILIAAPATILLGRRYQLQRLQVDPDPVHIRRTVLAAMAALVATLPFVGLSLGPWSSRSSASSARSASPLVPQPQRAGSGEESVLQRFARWLGFGDNGQNFQPGQGRFEQVQPGRPPEPDDPFNWWILLAIAAILALLILAWWLWQRRKPPLAPALVQTAADPLARLEAVGRDIGRPRRPFEGAITYGRELAKQTGDARFAATGPMVSSQVYQGAFVHPGEVDTNLTGIETAPPPPLSRPTRRERMSARFARVPRSPTAVLVGLVLLAAIVVVGWVVIPRLGDLEQDRFESSQQQVQFVPAATEYIDDI